MAWVTEPEFARNSAMTSSLGFVMGRSQSAVGRAETFALWRRSAYLT
jgi:hypothetical protein